jgi:hypothetical protein
VTAKPSGGLDRRLRNLTRAVNRLSVSAIFVGLLLAGTILYVNDERIPGLILGGLSLLALLFSIRR